MIIVQIRAGDLEPGDVINKRGPERNGWLEVDRVEELPGGGLVVHDQSERESFTADGYDLVWLQTLEELTGSSHRPAMASSELT